MGHLPPMLSPAGDGGKRADHWPRTNITATLHYTATWYQTAPVAAKARVAAMAAIGPVA